MAFTTENGRPLFNVCCLRNTATIVNDTLLEQLTRVQPFTPRRVAVGLGGGGNAFFVPPFFCVWPIFMPYFFVWQIKIFSTVAWQNVSGNRTKNFEKDNRNENHFAKKTLGTFGKIFSEL